MPADSTFQISVRKLTGENLSLSITAETTIAMMKSQIEELDGIPTDQQRLIFDGQQLEDDRTAGDYNIQAEALVHLVLRLRGD
jgi:ubiquitin-large subunit ribosomal protein L40e